MTSQTTQTGSAPDPGLSASPRTWPTASGVWGGATTARRSRLVLGLMAVVGLAGVALVREPSGSVAADGPRFGGGGESRAAGRHVPNFVLAQPATEFIDVQGLGGHGSIPRPPAHDPAGRSNLGVLVGPAWFVWIYGGTDGVRYSVVDPSGQALGQGLTQDEVRELFPEVDIPSMEFAPTGSTGPVMLMWAGETP